jgi:hypothetical protein
MQNSLLSPVVATHLVSTIRSFIGSMTFPTENTRFNTRKQQHLQYISISHHLSTQPPQHTTPCNLLASPPKLTTHTLTTPSTQPIHPKPPYHATIQTRLGECARQLGMAYLKSPPARLGKCARQLGMACPKSPPALAIHGCHSK